MNMEVHRSNHAKEPTIPAWYALYTRPNFEKRIDAQLKEMGLHSYLPLHTELRQWSDRKKRIQVPLFSCYVFVNTNPKERLLALQVNGVVRMLSNNGKPSRIPNEDIETIRRIIADVYDPESIPNLVPGDPVEIIAGPLKGLRGILREIQGYKRFIITFESIGQSVAINIKSHLVRKAAPGQNDLSFNHRTNSTKYELNDVVKNVLGNENGLSTSDQVCQEVVSGSI